MFRPAAGVVIDAHNLQHLVVYSVGDDKRRFGDDEFARAGHEPRVTELRIVCKQLFEAMDDVLGDRQLPPATTRVSYPLGQAALVARLP